MSAASLLARGRIAAEALMVDACVIRRVTGQTTDDLTGAVAPTYSTVYTGPCKVQATGGRTGGERVEVGEVAAVVDRLRLDLPVATSLAITHGDRVTITACTHDPDLVGMVATIHDPMGKSFGTARRLLIERVS